MLEKLAAFSGVWALLLLIAGYHRSEVLMGIFLSLYFATLIICSFLWLIKRFSQNRSHTCSRKKRPAAQAANQTQTASEGSSPDFPPEDKNLEHIQLSEPDRAFTPPTTAAKKSAPSLHDLVSYVMNDDEKEKCRLMLEKLDQDLLSAGTNRNFLKERHFGPGEPRFGYAQNRGYFFVLQPERAREIVPACCTDEEVFRKRILREAAKAGHGTGVFLTLTHHWGARAEHGEEKLELLYREKAYHFILTSTYWNDAGDAAAPPRITTRTVRTAKRSDFMHFTLSGFLFHLEVWHQMPGWAVEQLKQEKAFTDMFLPGTDAEKEGRVYWCNAGNPQEKWVVWFEQQEGSWYAHGHVRLPDTRIEKVTPLPQAGDRAIAELLMLDPFIYVHQPDIENWCLEDRSARVTLFRKTSTPKPSERLTLQYVIDKRNGALYCIEGHSVYAGGDRGPIVKDGSSITRPAFYQELISADIRYRGMTLKNWRNYLPDGSIASPNAFRVSVKEAQGTFSKEEQEQFQERTYQYHIDVQRGGTPPEVAASSRDMVLIDGLPVPAEVADRMKELEAEKKNIASKYEIYRHERKGFYDEESYVRLGEKSALVHHDTPYAAGTTPYRLPPFMLEAGFTRGGLLTWLKSQGCTISFPKNDLTDDTVLRPHAVLMMGEKLPVSGFGKKLDTIDVHFYTGSNCLSTAAVYGMKDGTEWLLSSNNWRDEHDPQYDTSMECAIRHIYDGSMTERSKTALKHMAQRIPTLWQARQFASLRLYHADIPLSEYGEVVKELYDWGSSMGHDSQSWDCRVHTTALHRTNDCHYVIDRTLWIDGTTQEHRWITTVAQLKPGQESAITANRFHEAIAGLPYRNPAAW